MRSEKQKKKGWLSWRGCLLILGPIMLLLLGLVTVPLVKIARYRAVCRQLEATESYIVARGGPYPDDSLRAPFQPVSVAALGAGASDREFETVAQFKSIEHIEVRCTPSVSAMRSIATLPELTTVKIDLPVGSVPLGALRELRVCKTLKALRLICPGVNDDDISFITALTQLELLLIVDAVISDQSLRSIGQLPNLRNLRIYGCHNLTERGVSHLSLAKNLEVIRVHNAPVGNELLKALSNLSVRELELKATGCTNQGFQKIASLKTLTELSLYEEAIDDDTIMHVGDLPVLEQLIISNCKNVTPEGIEYLRVLLPKCEIIYGLDPSLSNEE